MFAHILWNIGVDKYVWPMGHGDHVIPFNLKSKKINSDNFKYPVPWNWQKRYNLHAKWLNLTIQ